jgi:hypothetical protein
MNSFNVIITTIGRPELQRMLDSICGQLSELDYLTIIWDGGCSTDFTVNTKATVISIINSTQLGHWGHGSRTKWQHYLPGDYFINGDDDDVFTSEAMTHIRNTCLEDKLYIFKMLINDGIKLPSYPVIEFTNIGTPCGVYMPSNLPEWDSEYGGDYRFYKKLSETKEPVFIDYVTYKVKP